MASTSSSASLCVRLAVSGHSEELVNQCNQCRVVSIIRSRPGNEVPVDRKYNVQANSTFPVPFRGPGRSRILSDFPCKGEPGGDQDLLKKQSSQTDQSCVGMERSPTNAVMLVNHCNTCRAVAIQRMASGSKNGVKDYFLISGGAKLPLSSNGFDSVGLIGDIACPS